MSATGRIDELKKRYDENPRRFFAPLANEYRKSGDLDAAIALCQEHLADQPGNMNGHVVYGQALFEAARYDEAQVTFEAALALDPENLIALRHLGDMARTSGDRHRAREWYERVLDADPRNDEILAFLREIDDGLAAEAASAPAVIAAPPPADPTTSEPIALMDAMPSPAAARSREALGEATTLEMRPVAPPSSRAATPVVPFRDQPPPPATSVGLMDLSIDIGAPVATEFGAGLAASMPPADTPVATPAASLAMPNPPKAKDPINEAFADSFGVLFEESPSGPVSLPTSTPPAQPDVELLSEFSIESAHDFSFETSPSPFAEPAPGVEEAVNARTGADTEPATGLPTNAFSESISDFARQSAAEPSVEPIHAAAVDPIDDYLFGHLPPALPSVEVERTTERPMENVAGHPVETAVPFEVTPSSGTDRLDSLGATPQAFVTETMAELYLQQGFRDEALNVYRQLSALHPDDERLRGRLRELEDSDRDSVARVADAADAAAGSEAPADVPAVTVRSFFAALSLRRALRSDGTPPIGIDAVVEAPLPVAPDGPAGSAAAHPFVVGGTLDSLFGGHISPADEQLASSIASMADAIEVPAPSVKGQPTKPAETELSLENVFRATTPRASAVVSRRSQKLRFDQFFTPSEDVGAVDPTPPASDPGSPVDLEQFSSWLQGLKPK